MFSLLEAKGVAAVLLGGGSLFTGLLPKWIGLADRIEHSLSLSLILCFGAGVLLATSILHILHDTMSALPDWGEIVFCAGFMALYFVDELVQFFCLVRLKNQGSSHHHHHDSADAAENDRLLGDNGSHAKYGSIRKSSSLKENPRISETSSVETCKRQDDTEEFIPEEKTVHEQHATQEEKQTESHHFDSQPFSDATKAKNKSVKEIGLIIALCIHSVLEGLAVGTQPTSSKVVVLLLAVSCHKLVITFCLGAELVSEGSSTVALVGLLSIYAISSSAGVIIGAVMNSTNTAVIPLLQGLAGGSLLYITVGEILPRERFHKTHCNMPKLTGLIQFLFVLFGIIPIAIMNKYLGSNGI